MSEFPHTRHRFHHEFVSYTVKIPTPENRCYGEREREKKGGRGGERRAGDNDLALGHGLDIVSRKSRYATNALTSSLDHVCASITPAAGLLKLLIQVLRFRHNY